MALLNGKQNNKTLFLKSHFSKLTKFNKMVKNHQKKIKKGSFVTKITNTFDVSSQKSKTKIGRVFLGLFTWNNPVGILY